MLHECTSHFVRKQFPQYLPDYQWFWPSRYDNGGDTGGGGDVENGGDPDCDGCDDVDAVPDRILELSPCYFGWPATRNRCYTVSWLLTLTEDRLKTEGHLTYRLPKTMSFLILLEDFNLSDVLSCLVLTCLTCLVLCLL